MRTDFYYDSKGVGKIHGCRWTPQGEVKAVVQIVHGIAEIVERYDAFARFLNQKGVLVVAEDHMGHGKSIDNGGTLGYFDGGWDTACDDTYQLLVDTKREFPEVPYVLFGHSMGSFMTRSILYRYPDSGISAAIICGTGWMSEGVLSAGQAVTRLVCRFGDERKPSKKLQGMMFGTYNKKVEHPRTDYDWLTRDTAFVDAYIAHPMCGFTASAGLMRDMLGGMIAIQKPENLGKMDKKLPVLFVAGGDDPVGDYGRGVRTAGAKFQEAGMEDVTVKLFPMCRHEILNEWGREEIFAWIYRWMEIKIEEISGNYGVLTVN